ncbi:MAG: SUMF1/EgtB/PvdO family nonheme iron enzyme [Planctomycetes bacterium]|nr:SUMF1/EgtB/PvdO family nonheme iron enzyme [Planctomycetota bacterium]
MHLNSLFAVTRASFPIGILLAGACAQATVVNAQVELPGAKPPTNAPADPRLVGLPEFLLMVPGGTVEVGLKADELIQAACQVVNPRRPETAPKIAASKVEKLMKQSASLLGRQKIDIEPFLLARAPVTCAQWERYLIEKRKTGKMRPPFDWWRDGREDDYNAKLQDITREFPGAEDGPLLYWDRHGGDLPYSLKLKDGTSFADWPVTFVDYREANEFAAWLGMRLPTEHEWTRAARGDGSNVWPWGGQQGQDAYAEDNLEQLRLLKTSDKKRKPVGTVAAGAGPYGHVDMFGQVWQFVSGLSYRPINGEEPFKDEWKRMQKDKVGGLLTSPPLWRDNWALGKGGSFLSGGEPIQLLVDARAPFQTIDVLTSVGVRLAKSLRPGYDLLYSLLRSTYDRSPFASDQDIDLTQQVGAERYEIGTDGFPTAYHAVSMAPVNWLSQEKSADVNKLLEKTQQEPMLVATFATTVPLADPAVPAGHYSVLFRKEGMPRELVDAIKAGHKEMVALARKPKKDDDKDKDTDDGGTERKAGWRDVLARYGLTEADVAGKEAANGLKFVRVDGVQVSTERDCFLLHGNEGKVVAVVPAPNQKVSAASGAVPSSLTLEADAKGRAVAKFRIGSLATSRSKKIVEIPFQVTLDRTAPTGDDAWRLPGN